MSQALHYDDSHSCSCRHSTPWKSPRDGLLGFVRPSTHKFHGWIERRRQRRALRALDNRLLDDIGVSRDEAMHECAGRFWQAYARRHLK